MRWRWFHCKMCSQLSILQASVSRYCAWISHREPPSLCAITRCLLTAERLALLEISTSRVFLLILFLCFLVGVTVSPSYVVCKLLVWVLGLCLEVMLCLLAELLGLDLPVVKTLPSQLKWGCTPVLLLYIFPIGVFCILLFMVS